MVKVKIHFDRPSKWGKENAVEMPTEIKMLRVKSSNIEAVGYDRKSRTLRLKFHYEAATYDYEPVPPSLHKQLMAAESKGAFFREKILQTFKAKKLE